MLLVLVWIALGMLAFGSFITKYDGEHGVLYISLIMLVYFGVPLMLASLTP